MINKTVFTLVGTTGGGTTAVSKGASGGTVNHTTQNLGDVGASGLLCYLNITGNSGTNPTITVKVQDSPDNATWFDLVTFTAVTGSTSVQAVQTTRAPAQFIRGVSIVGGTSTPTWTYNLQVVAIDALALSVSQTLGGAASFLPLTLGPSANGGNAQIVINSENLTLSTSGLTTDTTGLLLPANSLILAVNGTVTTTITTSTDWKLGDSVTAARFTAADTTLTAGEKQVGILQWSGAVTTLAAGPSQAAAAKVRVSVTGANAGAGAIRIEVIALVFTAPTS